MSNREFDPVQLQLLQRLAAGAVISGADLARHLGISRNAVWKRVSQLRALGLDVTAVRGQGYHLPVPLELLDRKRIAGYLPTPIGERVAVQILPSTVSTNLVLAGLPLAEQHGTVVLAEYQSAGRGRSGRNWHSPFASNLYLTMGWHFESGVAAIACLSLATGVALIRALAACGVPAVKLKWPNDLRLRGKKLAGTLIEVNGDLNGPCQAIIGIGINVRMPVDTRIDQPWTDLSCVPEPPGRNRLAAAIIEQLVLALQDFAREGFAPFQEEWRSHDELAGRAITVLQGNRRLHGIARGLSESGGLLVRLEEGMQEFHSGDVSIRDA